jgi:uncharacterized protein (DUF433 family)
LLFLGNIGYHAAKAMLRMLDGDPMEQKRPPMVEIARDPEVRSGAPIMAGTRMAVHDIVSYWRIYDGDVQRVIDDFPYLTVEQIQAVLDWYREHQEEIDEILCQRRESYERLLAEKRARSSQPSPVASHTGDDR